MCADEKQFVAGSLDISCTEDNPLAESDASIPELCDFKDNNCNGEVDEGCECFLDDPRECWNDDYPIEFYTVSGEDFGSLHGICDYGRQVCRFLPEGGSELGAWEEGPDRIGGTGDDIWVKGLCIDIQLPATEICDGRDNNCDNSVDESLKRSCWSGPRKQDGTPLDYLVFNDPRVNSSPCKKGIQTCQFARWTGCLHEVLPSEELCDGIDNNCNGVVDEGARGVGAECGMTDEGICEYGHYDCVWNGSKADLECQDTALPETEVCDNLDNDCDGAVDELLVKPCQTICGSGFEICNAGSWIDCTANLPVEESCNGLDDDCDGLIDEDLNCACPPEMVGGLFPCNGNPILTCGLGYMRCECDTPECITTHYTVCQALCVYRPEIQEGCIADLGLPEAEICNNWDDDCDEEVDEDLSRSCYTGPLGTLNVGVCAEGGQTCQRGIWGDDAGDVFIENLCPAQTLPTEEVCNHLDDDCDGETDEDLDAHDKVDMVFVIDRSGSMCSTIRALKRGIQPYVLEYIGTPHRFAIINVPGSFGNAPDVLINFVSAEQFQIALNGVGCNLGGREPQYDAVYHVARNDYALSFRDDAFPMMVVFTDEVAQSTERNTAATVRNSLSPCQVGDCGQEDVFEVYAIVPQAFNNEWCEPSNIAMTCYNLYGGITSEEIRGYLNDIFSEVCR